MTNNLNYKIGASSLPFHPLVYKQIVSYLKVCLHSSAGVTASDELSKTVTKKLSQYAASLRSPALSVQTAATQTELTESDSMMTYYKLIRMALSQIAGSDVHVVVLKCLFELVNISGTLMSTVADQTGWLKQTFVESSHDETREAAAKLVGCVAGKLDNTRLLELVLETKKALNSKSFEAQHGAVVLLGRLLPSCVNSSTHQLSLDIYKETFMSLASVLNGEHPKLIAAACKAIGLVSLQCVLPLENGHEEIEAISDEASANKRPKVKLCTTKLDIVEILGSHLCQHAVLKVKEKAATALGLLPIGDKQFPHTKTALKKLFESAKSKQVDLQFVVADAIACASCRSASHILDVPELEQDMPNISKTDLSQDTMTWTLQEIASHYVNHSVSHLRQAACIWLLAIVRTAGEHPVVKGQLQRLQSMLVNYLTDRDEFTQEVASRALGLVYERGSSKDKEELVSQLVDTLMTGRKSSQPVSGDTRIFEERELGISPEGSGLSTYKELCSLASDLNQPDLIYKFMRLANHNAIWSSKKGAAFGFSTIAAQAKEQLAPYLPVLVPRLFRYRYDPNPGVQQAMNSIWTAVVPDSQAEVEKYFNAILEDVLTSLSSGTWRIRQSCCLALSDLLQGRQIPDDCIEQLPRMWEVVLRARDDIKETVRKAADVACKTMSKLSIKLCDMSYGKSGQRAVAVLLPCLLDKLVTSRVSEIRAISLVTLLEISKNAGPQLKPHIPAMVVVLLETLSSLEPQVLNYVSLHVGSDSEGQDKLDSIRVSASKSSPMMETVNLCMRHVDQDVLPELCAKLSDLTRSAIGIATKVGCCQVIVSLCHQCTRDLTPHAGKLLSSLLSCFNDRSPGVRKAAATAVGHLVKYAKDSSVEKLISRVKTWYLEKDGR
jgi:proteasome component ECM29